MRRKKPPQRSEPVNFFPDHDARHHAPGRPVIRYSPDDVFNVPDWSAPTERRLCQGERNGLPCGTVLRKSNGDAFCSLCKDAEKRVHRVTA
jgi:hypothetical protein